MFVRGESAIMSMIEGSAIEHARRADMDVYTVVVDEDGRAALPREVLVAAMAEPGDLIECWAAGPQEIAAKVVFRIPTTNEAALFQTAATGKPPAARSAEGPATEGPERGYEPGNEPVDYDSLPRLTLAELLERYPIEGPVDSEDDRTAIHDAMAKDVLGERRDRFPS